MAKQNVDFSQIIASLPTDLSTLTETELQDKITKLESLASQTSGLNESNLFDNFAKRLRDYGVAPSYAGQSAEWLVSFAKEKGRYPSNEEMMSGLGGIISSDPRNATKLRNAINDQALRNEFSDAFERGDFNALPPQVSQKIADLKGLLNVKSGNSQSEKSVNEYLQGLPAENEKQIGEFEKSLQQSQGEFFGGELAPQIIQALNARGLAQGGELSDALASAGGKLQRGIRETIAPIRLQANQDVSNKKYENILRGALEQGQSLTSAVDFARNILSQDRQNQFVAGQGDLQRQYERESQNQNMALQLAMANAGRSSGPSGLDYFLQYGLPVLGQVGAGAAGPLAQKLLGVGQQSQQMWGGQGSAVNSPTYAQYQYRPQSLRQATARTY